MNTTNDAARLFPNGLSGLIYDCDGVMIDSRAANTLFYNRVLAYFGLPPMTPSQEHYSYMASGLQSLQAILPKELHPEISRVVREEVHYSDVVPYLTLMPGFRDFVCEMHDRGLKQAMCTNRTDAGFEEILVFFSFPRYFDPIMTVSKVAPKPSPEGAKTICAAWGLAPESILFLGDSAYDKEAASSAGIPFAAFNALNCTGDLVASSYATLHTLLAEVLPGPLS